MEAQITTQNLNLHFHTKKLVLKALNTYKTTSLAAIALGITERTLYNYKKTYCIQKNEAGAYKVNVNLTPSVKDQILSYLCSIDHTTIFGNAVHCFVNNSNKTDMDFKQMLFEIQMQIDDCPHVMKNLLGDYYCFFQMINIKI